MVILIDLGLMILLGLGFAILSMGVQIYLRRFGIDRHELLPERLKKVPSRQDKVRYLMFQYLGAAAALGAVLALAHLLYRLSLSLQPVAEWALSKPWMAAPLVAVSILFFWLRSRFLTLYGLLELAVAIAALLVTINSAAALGTKLISVIGAIYVIVRGLENVTKGLSPPLLSGLKRAFQTVRE